MRILIFILKKLKEYANTHLNQVTTSCVITVHDDITDYQRRAILCAADSVKLDILDLIEKPLAVALAHGIDECDDKATGEHKTVNIHLGGRSLYVTYFRG